MTTFTNVNIGVDATDTATIKSIQTELSNLGAYFDNDGSDMSTFNINAGFNDEQEARAFASQWSNKVGYLETETFAI